MVYHLPFYSYLAGSKSVSAAPSSDPDTITNTALDDTVSSSGKNATKDFTKNRTSRISHQGKLLLRVILNRFVNQVEQILKEEQAGFRSQRSNAQQIFNLRLMVEKCLWHQKELFHGFIDFKKAFDRVWHEGLWRVLKEYNIDNRLLEVIESLYDEANSDALANAMPETCFHCS